jgi:hypothetical protein
MCSCPSLAWPVLAPARLAISIRIIDPCPAVRVRIIIVRAVTAVRSCRRIRAGKRPGGAGRRWTGDRPRDMAGGGSTGYDVGANMTSGASPPSSPPPRVHTHTHTPSSPPSTPSPSTPSPASGSPRPRHSSTAFTPPLPLHHRQHIPHLLPPPLEHEHAREPLARLRDRELPPHSAQHIQRRARVRECRVARAA